MARADLIQQMLAALGPDGVIAEREQLRTYECDGLTSYRVIPSLVVLPETAAEVQAAVRICHRAGVPFVARGSGTGLSGGALPVEEGVLIVLSRMRRILEVDLPNQRVVVEPGVINLWVTEEVSPAGYYYAPDPSSQLVCSIGGNVAENSGGAHCLKYGFTTNHVTGLEVVLPDGELVQLGGKALDTPGYDLVGAFVGSEGTLGIATKITLRVIRKPEAVRTLLAAFGSMEEAGGAVSGIIAAGGDDGRPLSTGGGGRGPRRLPTRRRRPVDRRAGRAGHRGGAAVRGGGADLSRAWLHRVAGGPRRRGPHADVEGPQGSLRGHGADQPRLLCAGRRDSPHRAPRGAA